MRSIKIILQTILFLCSVFLIGCATESHEELLAKYDYHSDFDIPIRTAAQKQRIEDNWSKLYVGMQPSEAFMLLRGHAGIFAGLDVPNGTANFNLGGNLLRFREGKLVEFKANALPPPSLDMQRTSRTPKKVTTPQ